jgi:hypothetical protein
VRSCDLLYISVTLWHINFMPYRQRKGNPSQRLRRRRPRAVGRVKSMGRTRRGTEEQGAVAWVPKR